MLTLYDLIAQIAKRDSTRSEATLQADIRQLLLTAPFSLTDDQLRNVDLETQAGTRHRIDIEAGSCIIEVKRDLKVGKVLPEAIGQLSGYLVSRRDQTGCRYVGIRRQLDLVALLLDHQLAGLTGRVSPSGASSTG